MLVEEGGIPHALMLCGPSGSRNLPPFFAEIGVRKQNLPPVSSKNGKNYVFRGRNHQKSLKTANSVDGIIKKRRKLQIPWTESSKNGENCGFRGQNHQKTEKTGFPHPGENQNHPFFAFPHPGESQNHPFSAFPNLGKVKNARKQRFPTLGKSKTLKNCISQLWERQKHSKTAFPNLGKGKNTPRRLLQKKILIWRWPREPAHACFFAK